ncbi:MAG: T9SS type A sorting domain-containing protein [Candidatus Coatesbacteria bacterium]|nr:MAG: T9SS type A sorting domain-containing protein [Candidatus Coatesbacteria bacterium]
MLRNATTLVVGVALTALLAISAYADYLAPERTTLGKINLAVERGELPYDYAVTYKYLALFKGTEHLVPAQYRGERLGSAPWVSGTPIILELSRTFDTLRPELKALLEEHCGIVRSDGNGGLYNAYNYRNLGTTDSSFGGYPVYTYETENFKVHYTTEGPERITDLSDSDGDGIYDIVEWTCEDYEACFTLYTGGSYYGHTSKGDYLLIPVPGYEDYMPLRDYYDDVDGEPWPGDNYDYGGDDKWDVYLVNLGSGTGGATYIDRPFPLTSWFDYSSYAVQHNDIYYGIHGDAYSSGGWNTTSIAAHEFGHSMQFMHDALESSASAPPDQERWYLEATSMWDEHFCYEGQPDYLNRGGGWISNTLRSIEDDGYGGYDCCIINTFLEDWSEKGPIGDNIDPNKVVPEVWRAATGPGDPYFTGESSLNRDPKDAISYVVETYDTSKTYIEGRGFPDAFEIFTKWNWFAGDRDDGNHYVYGPEMSTVSPRFTYGAGDYPVNEEDAAPFYVDHLGHVYLRFNDLPDWQAGVLKYTASDLNPAGSEDWAGHVCGFKGGAWRNLEDVAGDWSDMLSPQDIGIIQIPNPDQYESVVFCLANTSYIGFDLDYGYSLNPSTDTVDPVTKLSVIQTQANPDYVELLIGSNENLFGFPEVFTTYTPDGGDSTKVGVNMNDPSDNGKSFTGTLPLDVGFKGSGVVDYRAADLAGNIVSGSKGFSAGTLSAGGGTVGAEGAYLRAPTGAFDGPTLVTIFEGETCEETPEATKVATKGTATSKVLPTEETVETIGTSYLYGPDWANLGAPVSVILSYDGLDVTKEDYLSVYQWNGSGWTDLGGTIDKAHRRVTADVNSLGEFVLGYGDKKEGDDGGFIPMSYALYQSYPNPAGTSAKVKYALPEDGHVTIKLYNIAGQVVKVLVDEDAAAGTYVKDVNANDLASGVYLYRMEAGGYSAVKKMVVTR